jgi:DNA repair protein RadC
MRHAPSVDPAQESFADLLFYSLPEQKPEPDASTPFPPPPLALPASETADTDHANIAPEDASWNLAETTLPLLPVVRVRLVRDHDLPVQNRLQITQPQDAAQIFSDYLQDRDREVFAVLMLDTKNRLIGLNIVSIGTLDTTLVSPREVFKVALLANAASLILAHNHPSGDPTPSPEDKAVTRRLYEAGQLLQIDVLDHLVIGEGNRFTSLKITGAF